MNYLEIAFLGELTGQANAALILDKIDLIKNEDINFNDIEKELENDFIYKILK